MNSVDPTVRLAAASVVFVFAVLQLGGVWAAIDLQSYLDLPTTKQLNSDPLHQDVRRALLQLNLAPGSSKESIKSKLNEVLGDELRKSSFGHIYRDLLALTDTEDDYCSAELLDVFHSIMAQMTTDEGKQLDAALSDYLKTFGPTKFALCAAKENENFVSRPQSQLDLNAAFRRAFGVGDRCDGLKLYDQLKEFDPARDAFNVRQMVEFVRAHVKDKQRAKSEDEFVVLDDFMRRACKQLGEQLPPRSRLYKIISLNRFFGSQVDFDTNLLLENEYHRLCLAWHRQRDDLERNIRSQVVKKRWLGFNFDWFNRSNRCG